MYKIWVTNDNVPTSHDMSTWAELFKFGVESEENLFRQVTSLSKKVFQKLQAF